MADNINIRYASQGERSCGPARATALADSITCSVPTSRKGPRRPAIATALPYITLFRYPPQGERSWGPARATALADTKEANAAVKVIQDFCESVCMY